MLPDTNKPLVKLCIFKMRINQKEWIINKIWTESSGSIWLFRAQNKTLFSPLKREQFLTNKFILFYFITVELNRGSKQQLLRIICDSLSSFIYSNRLNSLIRSIVWYASSLYGSMVNCVNGTFHISKLKYTNIYKYIYSKIE